MLEISSILIMSMVLLSLTIVLILLFIKHINVMYIFIEEIRKAQVLIHKDIVEIKLNLARVVSEGLKGIEKQDETVNQSIKEKKNSEIIKIPEINVDSLPANRKNKKEVQEKSYGDINNLNSFQVSKEELSKIIGDKELMFERQVSVSAGEMFINADINIDDENKK